MFEPLRGQTVLPQWLAELLANCLHWGSKQMGRATMHPRMSTTASNEWEALKEHRTVVPNLDYDAECEAEVPANILEQLTAFGWSLEDVEMQVR